MFWIIYICIALVLNGLCIFVFNEYLHVSALSLLPLVLMAIMLFQAIYYKKGTPESEVSTAYGSGFNNKEQSALLKYASKTLLGGFPLLIPFVFFFTDAVKILSVIVYILSFASGIIYYRIKYKAEFGARNLEEKRQLQEQIKKEAQGKWK